MKTNKSLKWFAKVTNTTSSNTEKDNKWVPVKTLSADTIVETLREAHKK